VSAVSTSRGAGLMIPPANPRQGLMRHPDSRSIAYQLLHVARLHRARTAMLLHEVGLFPGQEQALEALRARDAMSMSELAQILRVRPPTVSKTVARLSAAGLIERRGPDGDGRVVRVGLTMAGQEKAEALAQVGAGIEEDVTALLDDRERKRLRKLLKRVERSLRGAIGAPPMETELVVVGRPVRPDGSEDRSLPR